MLLFPSRTYYHFHFCSPSQLQTSREPTWVLELFIIWSVWVVLTGLLLFCISKQNINIKIPSYLMLQNVLCRSIVNLGLVLYFI